MIKYCEQTHTGQTWLLFVSMVLLLGGHTNTPGRGRGGTIAGQTDFGIGRNGPPNRGHGGRGGFDVGGRVAH